MKLWAAHVPPKAFYSAMLFLRHHGLLPADDRRVFGCFPPHLSSKRFSRCQWRDSIVRGPWSSATGAPMAFLPKVFGYLQRLDVKILPPRYFVANLMQLLMMAPT